MVKDVDGSDEVTRSVSTVELDGAPARRSVVSRLYATGIDDLWDALTNPDRIPRWFLPVSGDLRLGGTYQLEGNAGGRIEECEPPRRLRITWGMGEGLSTWVTVTLRPVGSDSRLELEHIGPVPEELWAMFGPSATGIGWDTTLLGLALHVEAPDAPHPSADASAWMASPEGLAFVQASGQAWSAADVAAGTEPDEAAARARRTVAAYTGQPDPT